jgi:hypothetical protein
MTPPEAWCLGQPFNAPPEHGPCHRHAHDNSSMCAARNSRRLRQQNSLRPRNAPGRRIQQDRTAPAFINSYRWARLSPKSRRAPLASTNSGLPASSIFSNFFLSMAQLHHTPALRTLTPAHRQTVNLFHQRPPSAAAQQSCPLVAPEPLAS